jgi:hypothetical protein
MENANGSTYAEPMQDDKDIPDAWRDSLALSKAQAERGETVPLEPFMARLRASIQRMRTAREAEQNGTLNPPA